MAFGSIQVVSLEQPQAAPRPAPEMTRPAPEAAGRGTVDIVLAAPTLAEADDFLCGVYFNLGQVLSGSSASVYTRQLAAITRLVEIKQELELRCAAPVGQESVRTIPEGSAPLTGTVLTLSRSGSQTLALDLRFRCVTPAALSTAGSADAVWVLLGQDEASRSMAQAVRRELPGRAVFWIAAGFEGRYILPANHPSHALDAAARGEMCARLGVPCTPGDSVGFAQTYGALEPVRRGGQGEAVVRTHQRCREYTPVACHLPVYKTLEEAMGRRRELSAGCGELWVMLQAGFAPWLTAWNDWCGTLAGERKGVQS